MNWDIEIEFKRWMPKFICRVVQKSIARVRLTEDGGKYVEWLR